jgi:Bacterial membrane protein YfhO
MVAQAIARLRRRLLRHPVACAAGLYALLAALLIGPGLLPGHTVSGSDYLWSAAPWQTARPSGVPDFGRNAELADPVTVFQPFLGYTREQLPTIPLWNPHLMAGRPFVANAQSAVFSLFSVPSYVLPFWWSLSLVAALKVFVAAFGTFLLGRALSMSWAGAFLAGVVFGFSLFFVVWLPWPLTSIWALLPLLLLATNHLVRRPGPLSVTALAVLVGAQYFGGHPESSFHTMVAVCAFFLLRVLQTRRQRATREVRAAILAFSAAVIAGTALAALAIVPFAELLARSADIVKRGDEDPTSLPRKYLLALLLSDYWGRPTQTPLEGFIVQRALYVGALPLMLAAAALLWRPRVERVAIAVFGVVVLAVVVGLPPVFQVVTSLPGFSNVHNTRMAILAVLCVALLAGWGLDDLIRQAPRGRRATALLAGAAGLVVAPLVFVVLAGRSSWDVLGQALDVAWGFVHPPPGTSASAGPIVRGAALIVWLTFGVTALALLAARARRRLPAGAFAALAVGLVLADLFRAGMGQNPALPVDQAGQPATGAIRFLRAQRPARFAGVPPLGVGVNPLPPDVAMRYGLYDARGYDYPVERRYDRLWRRTVAPPPGFVSGLFSAPATRRSLRTLGLLSVRHLLQQPADPPLRVPGLRLAYAGPDARVYENRAALPRAFLVGAQTVVDSEGAALRATSAPGFDPRRSVITERRLLGLPVAATGSAPPPGTARVTVYRPDRVGVRVRAQRPSELVLTDVAFPGWQATLDGRPVDLHRVDYLLRGVRVPSGEHTVEMRYRPLAWRAGWIVSVLAAAALAVAAWVGLRRRRRQPARSVPVVQSRTPVAR